MNDIIENEVAGEIVATLRSALGSAENLSMESVVTGYYYSDIEKGMREAIDLIENAYGLNKAPEYD